MNAQDFQLPLYFSYAATFSWAMTGAVVGIRKQFDLVGVFVIALLSSTGGGLVRDAVFLQRTPSFVLDPVYLPLIGGTTVLMALFTVPLTRLLSGDTVKKLVDVIDAIGTPAFAVIGMQMAESRALPIFGVIFIGLVNGCAGGLLRDVVVRDVPALLRPGQFVTLALAMACGGFMILRIYYGVGTTQAAQITIATFFVFRLLAVRFNWQSRSVAGDDGLSAITGHR